MRSSRFCAALWLVVFAWLARWDGLGADDLTSLRQQIKELQDKNKALEDQLQSQKQLMESLARRLDQLEPGTAETPRKDDLTPGPLIKSLTSGRLVLSGEGGAGFFHSDSAGQFSKAGFTIDEAKIFVDANIYKNFYAFAEINLTTREADDDKTYLGEFYLDWENIHEMWGEEHLLNLRIGRLDIPFGEEYLSRDAVDNPLITHSLADIWGVDEGLEIYGSAKKLRYVFAVQNGSHPSFRDFDADKALTLRLGYDPTRRLHFSASGMRTGNIDTTSEQFAELWFGGGLIRQMGFSPRTKKFHMELAQGDAQYKWDSGRATAAGGVLRFNDDQPGVNHRRNVYYYSVEGIQNIVDKFYGAVRGSQMFAPVGFPIVADGQFGPRVFGPPTRYSTQVWRLSLGLGYRWTKDLVIKAEYSFEGGRDLSGAGRDHENTFGIEAAFKF